MSKADVYSLWKIKTWQMSGIFSGLCFSQKIGLDISLQKHAYSIV